MRSNVPASYNRRGSMRWSERLLPPEAARAVRKGTVKVNSVRPRDDESLYSGSLTSLMPHGWSMCPAGAHQARQALERSHRRETDSRVFSIASFIYGPNICQGFLVFLLCTGASIDRYYVRPNKKPLQRAAMALVVRTFVSGGYAVILPVSCLLIDCCHEICEGSRHLSKVYHPRDASHLASTAVDWFTLVTGQESGNAHRTCGICGRDGGGAGGRSHLRASGIQRHRKLYQPRSGQVPGEHRGRVRRVSGVHSAYHSQREPFSFP
eukprot:5285669-Pyramimonas_sp.AAC.4